MCASVLAGSRRVHKTYSLWSIPGSGQGVCERVFNVVWQYWVFYISSTKLGSDWCRVLVSLVTTGTEHIRACRTQYTHNTRHTDYDKVLYTTVIKPLIVHCSLEMGEQPVVPVLLTLMRGKKCIAFIIKRSDSIKRIQKDIIGKSSLMAMALWTKKAVGMQAHPCRAN